MIADEITTLDLDAQCREVYARFGLAMYCAQVMEVGLVNVLAAVRIRRGVVPPEEEGQDFFEVRFRRRVADLIRELRDAGRAPGSLISELHGARAERNRLAHRFFFERATDFFTPAGRQSMVDELQAAADRFSALDRQLQSILLWLGHRHGLTSDRIEEEASRMLAELGEQDLPFDGGTPAQG